MRLPSVILKQLRAVVGSTFSLPYQPSRTFTSSPFSAGSSLQIDRFHPSRRFTSVVASSIAERLRDRRERLFAVVYINSRQWKVTAGDVIQCEGPMPVEMGDNIKLEKVLMIGSSAFSLFGRPFLDAKEVQVEATIVEQSTKYPELYYRKFNHKQIRIIKWRTVNTTLLRIDAVRASATILDGRTSEESTAEATTVN